MSHTKTRKLLITPWDSDRPPGGFKTIFHVSTGEGAGPDSLTAKAAPLTEETMKDALNLCVEDYVKEVEAELLGEKFPIRQPQANLNRTRPLTKEENREVARIFNERNRQKDLEQANDANAIVSEEPLFDKQKMAKQKEQYIRYEVTRLNVDMGYWTPQQGVTFVDTGCHDCADGTDDRDHAFRCLEHRKTTEPKAEHRWDGRYYECAFITDGIAALDLEAPDSIERRHQRAANRWGQVRSSYRRR